MEFNNMLINKYKSVNVYFNIIYIYRKNKKYIISLYNNDNKLLLRGEYILLGSYKRAKNFWIWGDQSFTLDKSMVYDISNMRKNLLNRKIDNDFIKNNYTVITTNDFNNNCKILDTLLKGDIYIDNINDITNVILITKTLQNNIGI